LGIRLKSPNILFFIEYLIANFYREQMNFLKSYWFYIIPAAITIFGLITGWYIFVLFAIPFGFFGGNKSGNGED